MKDPKIYLKKLGIKFIEHSHPAVYTCEQAEKYHKTIKGIHSKSLFLKSKKQEKYYLMIMPCRERLDIKKLEVYLNEKLTFADEKELKEILGLTPGSVSPFGLLNDSKHQVFILINKEVWESKIVNFHPNINTQSLEFSGKDFQKYIKSLKNKFEII